MADKIEENNEEPINETGYTNFGGSAGRAGTYYTPTGPIGRFFAKFFATKAQPAVQKALDSGQPTSLTGDTIKATGVLKDTPGVDSPAIGGVVRNPVVPQNELNRKKRYKEYEEMDEYPEVGAAFDIYADDTTQRGSRRERWTVDSESSLVVEEVEDLFANLKLDKILWDIARNTVKYGDCFIEMIVNVEKPEEGIKKLKVLNPNYLLRVENEFGYLKKFLQEIPSSDVNEVLYNGTGEQRPVKYIELDKHQIVHFRLHTSDPVFYPYGKSIAALCHRIFRSLKMMEDAMMIYRLSRAPERRIFYIDTGNLPTSKAEMFIERIKQKFKKEKFYQGSTNQVNARYNPMSMDEDFFVATKNGRGTKIETLPGATNLGEIEDVRYYRDKLLAALKIPKDYLVEKDKSPERKANLSQLDVKFARTIQRVQVDIESGLENLAKRHLQLKGFPASLIKKLRITLPEPSDMSAKRKLDLDQAKIGIISQVQNLGLLPKKQIYMEYFDMTEEEAERTIQEMKSEQAEAAAEAAAAQTEPGAAGAPAAPAMESAENTAPTANESTESPVEFMLNRTLDEEAKEVMARIVEKQKQKAEEMLKS
jgi:hypothetical protein